MTSHQEQRLIMAMTCLDSKPNESEEVEVAQTGIPRPLQWLIGSDHQRSSDIRDRFRVKNVIY
jgi:hypothetical protein